MRFKQTLNKINKILPIIFLGFARSSFFITRSERDARLTQETNEINRLSAELKRNQDVLIVQQENQDKIKELSLHTKELLNKIKTEESLINQIYNELNKSTNEDIKNKLIKDLTNHQNILENTIQSTKNDLNQINDLIISSKPLESNMIGEFKAIYESCVSMISKLELEQIVAFANLSGLIHILFCLLTIISILYGEYLINYFKLEEKYPKFAKIIQFRTKIKKYSLIFNILLISTMLILLIAFNIYVFISPYI